MKKTLAIIAILLMLVPAALAEYGDFAQEALSNPIAGSIMFSKSAPSTNPLTVIITTKPAEAMVKTTSDRTLYMLNDNVPFGAYLRPFNVDCTNTKVIFEEYCVSLADGTSACAGAKNPSAKLQQTGTITDQSYPLLDDRQSTIGPVGFTLLGAPLGHYDMVLYAYCYDGLVSFVTSNVGICGVSATSYAACIALNPTNILGCAKVDSNGYCLSSSSRGYVNARVVSNPADDKVQWQIGCVSDSNCAQLGNYVCNTANNVCVTKCTSNSQCSSGQYCDATGRCQSGCTDNSGCASGKVCTNNQCVADCQTTGCSTGSYCQVTSGHGVCTAGCQTDNNCAIGTYCKLYSGLNYGRCLTGCTSNARCSSGQVCNLNTNTCQAACTSATCAVEYYCASDGFCKLGCLDDSNCGYDITGKICTSGSCVSGCPIIPCNTGTYCNLGRCLAGCRANSDCASGQICSSGSCITGCTSSSQCFGGKVCSNNQCVTPCTSSSCPSGQYCANTGICQTGCANDANCASGQVCTNSQCVAGCTATSCGAGKYCSSGRCLTGCANDANCASGQVCTSGSCVAGCTANSCPAGQKCDSSYRCVTDSCSADSQCSGGKICLGNVCSPAQCTTSNDCTGGQLCTSGRCTSCTSDSQCGTGKICQNGGCTATLCSSGNDCTSGVCTSGRCVSCTSNSQCATGKVCQSGICSTPQPQCSSNGDCGSKVCQSGSCISCTTSSQCSTGKVCQNGDCITTSGSCDNIKGANHCNLALNSVVYTISNPTTNCQSKDVVVQACTASQQCINAACTEVTVLPPNNNQSAQTCDASFKTAITPTSGTCSDTYNAFYKTNADCPCGLTSCCLPACTASGQKYCQAGVGCENPTAFWVPSAKACIIVDTTSHMDSNPVATQTEIAASSNAKSVSSTFDFKAFWNQYWLWIILAIVCLIVIARSRKRRRR
jgi:Cys-rich repeat protein